MTTLARQNAAIDAAIRHKQTLRKRITLAGLSLSAIGIIALSCDTLNSARLLSIAQYKAQQCELVATPYDHSMFYECPTNN